MDSFDFDKLEPTTLEKTLTYLRAPLGTTIEDHAVSNYGAMFEETIGEDDWVGQAINAEAGGSPSLDIVQENAWSEKMVVLDEEAGESSFSLAPAPTPSKVLSFQAVWPGVREMGRQCTWNNCEWSPSSQSTFDQHTNEHFEVASKLWFNGSRCVWQGCKSKERFNTKPPYLRHLKNVHTEPLLCTEKGCRYGKPFRDVQDLRRHHSTQHTTTKEYGCPYDSCEASLKTFARKDKWIKHIADTEHQEDAICPFLHCRAKQLSAGAEFSSREQIVNHFVWMHASKDSSGLSCGLGSCRTNISGDRWTRYQMAIHLYNCHGLSGIAWKVALSMKHPNNILTAESLSEILSMLDASYAEDWAREYHDCNVCSQESNGK